MTTTADVTFDHRVAEPPILYFGTPVVLISTRNADGTENLAPMSSAWWLGWRCVLGLAAASRTTENLLREREGVLNLPSVDLAPAVDRLALTTGSDPVPEAKLRRGYEHEPAKFARAGLHAVPAHTVDASRVGECPVQLEVVVEDQHGIAADDPQLQGRHVIIETRVRRVHLAEHVTVPGEPDRVDPDRWNPLIMSSSASTGPPAPRSPRPRWPRSPRGSTAAPTSTARGPDGQRP